MKSFTEKEARQKMCHRSPLMHCLASQCMAWENLQPETLFHTGLKPEFAAYQFVGYDKQKLDEADAPSLEKFHKPEQPGWVFIGFEPSPEEGWQALWQTTIAPTPIGYCAALFHPAETLAALESLEEILCELGPFAPPEFQTSTRVSFT